MSKEDESKIEIPDTQVAIAIAGSVDSGKSSYIGVTTSGVLDNGRGSARAGVAKHPHEVESGQTSDISTRILNIKDKNKAITFVDLCGHEKYLKTTVRGIASYFPDYGCIIVSPQREVTDMTTQHYKMLISHNIPIFIVVTRVDVSLEEQYNRTLKSIERMCKKSGHQKVDIINTYYTYHKQKSGEIDDEVFKKEKKNAIDKVIENMDVNKNGKQILVPVITISNVDGYYIDVCKKVMGSIEPREIWNQTSTNNRVVKMFQKKLNLKDDDIKSDFDGSLFYIDSAFNKQGVGLVVSGINRGKTIKIGDSLFIGPFGKEFIEVKIKGIHNNDKTDIPELKNHSRGCCNIVVKDSKHKGLRKNNIKKGVIMGTKEMLSRICFRFKAAIFVFAEKSISIKPGYAPVINSGVINQTARVLKDDTFKDIVTKDGTTLPNKVLGPGSVESMWFKFTMRPEFIDKGSLLIFRSGKIHGVGMIIDVSPIADDDDKADLTKKNGDKKKQKIKSTKAKGVVKAYKKVDITDLTV